MRETYYVCVYRYEDVKLRFIKETEIKSGDYNCGITDCSSGFWVNEDYEFTKLGDNKYWIPPSNILVIKKKTREVL